MPLCIPASACVLLLLLANHFFGSTTCIIDTHTRAQVHRVLNPKKIFNRFARRIHLRFAHNRSLYVCLHLPRCHRTSHSESYIIIQAAHDSLKSAPDRCVNFKLSRVAFATGFFPTPKRISTSLVQLLAISIFHFWLFPVTFYHRLEFHSENMYISLAKSAQSDALSPKSFASGHYRHSIFACRFPRFACINFDIYGIKNRVCMLVTRRHFQCRQFII